MDYYDSKFLLQKNVDWSLLNEGLTIPVSVCSLFKAWDASILNHGLSKDIKILIDGEFYEAKLKNQNFEQSKWAGHKDVIQIRYNRQSQLAIKLRSVFKSSYDYLSIKRQELGKSKISTCRSSSRWENALIDIFLQRLKILAFYSFMTNSFQPIP